MQIIFKYFHVQTHVQIACEPPDLNVDFLSFDNGLKCYTNIMFVQEHYGKYVSNVNSEPQSISYDVFL